MIALGWRYILVFRNHGDAGKDPRTSVATMEKLLAAKKIEVGVV